MMGTILQHARCHIAHSGWSTDHRSGLKGSGLDTTRPAQHEQEPLCMSLLLFCLLHVATCTWIRLISPYSSFPWKLAALVDPRTEPWEKEEIGKEFLLARPCCLDEGFGARLRSKCTEVRQLHEEFRPVLIQLSHQKVINSEIENNFARAASTAKCARGHGNACSKRLG